MFSDHESNIIEKYSPRGFRIFFFLMILFSVNNDGLPLKSIPQILSLKKVIQVG